MKILIDIDDVLCHNGFLGVVNKFLNTSYTIDEIPSANVQDIIPEERKAEFYNFFFDNNVYDYAEVMEGSIEVLERLSKKHELYIFSTYIVDKKFERSTLLIHHKHNWLTEYFPFISPYHFIFTSSKVLLDAEVKIDDRACYLEGATKYKLLFDSHHNHNISEEELKENNIIRVHNWNEIEDILINL